MTKLTVKNVLDVLSVGQYFVDDSDGELCGNFNIDIKLNGLLIEKEDIKKYLKEKVKYWSFIRPFYEDEHVEIILENENV